MPKTEEKTAATKRAGFDDRGRAYKGVDPKTGERVTVVLSELKREFGPRRGEEIYIRVAEAAGLGGAFLRVDEYAPDVSLGGMDDEQAARVRDILAGRGDADEKE